MMIYSEIEVKDVYNGFDGLSRTDRIRYDTPELGGFSLAGSYSSGDAFDGSIWYVFRSPKRGAECAASRNGP